MQYPAPRALLIPLFAASLLPGCRGEDEWVGRFVDTSDTGFPPPVCEKPEVDKDLLELEVGGSEPVTVTLTASHGDLDIDAEGPVTAVWEDPAPQTNDLGTHVFTVECTGEGTGAVGVSHYLPQMATHCTAVVDVTCAAAEGDPDAGPPPADAGIPPDAAGPADAGAEGNPDASPEEEEKSGGCRLAGTGVGGEAGALWLLAALLLSRRRARQSRVRP